MIRTCHRPRCFDDLKGDFLFLECYRKKDIYAYAAVDIKPPSALFHLEVLNWGHNTLKRMIVDWDEFKQLMVRSGVTQICITKEGSLEDNKSYLKFLKKFGLGTPRQIMIAAYDL